MNTVEFRGVRTPSDVAHSHIGASSSDRWMTCPGSVKLSRGVPKVTSRYAEEGTKGHDVAAMRLTSGQEVETDLPEDYLEAIAVYVDFVEKESFRAGHKLERLIEHTFDLSEVHPGMFGTCDAIIFDAYAKRLKVIDLKLGAGIPVEAENNSQLMYYALGALVSTKFPAETVELVIVQPRCNHPDGPIRRWSCDALAVFDFSVDLKEAALRTEAPDASLVPGDHCRFCPANALCPALRNKAQDLAKREFGALAPSDGVGNSVGEAHAERLREALTWLPVLEGWIKGVRDFAYGLASQGKTIPGFKLVEKRAMRKWRDEKEIEKFLLNEFPDSAALIYEEPALKSVAQMEKILHKKQLPKLEPFIVKESSGTVLVEESDKRPAVKVLDAKTEFGSLDLFE